MKALIVGLFIGTLSFASLSHAEEKFVIATTQYYVVPWNFDPTQFDKTDSELEANALYKCQLAHFLAKEKVSANETTDTYFNKLDGHYQVVVSAAFRCLDEAAL